MTADRDALRDLLGFLERAIREVNFGDLSGEAHDTAARARRHLDRTKEAAAGEREAALAPFRELFSGGPDTACRTTWREVPGIIGGERNRTECVEVPMDELRAAFDAAEAAR